MRARVYARMGGTERRKIVFMKETSILRAPPAGAWTVLLVGRTSVYKPPARGRYGCKAQAASERHEMKRRTGRGEAEQRRNFNNLS